MFATLWQDLRYAARSLSKRAGFTATAVLTLALGIGASAATFSVVYGVILKPLAFDEPERLVTIEHRGSMLNGSGFWNHGPATYVVAADNQRAFEAVGGWDDAQVSVTGRGDPEQVAALALSSTTLPLLRIQPLLGTFFVADDDRPETPRRVVLTYGYWQRGFGGARDVIGRMLTINGAPAEIIGVAPERFSFPRAEPALLLPLKVNRAATGISFGFQAIGRLRDGVDLEQASADMTRWLTYLPDHFDRLQLAPHIRPLAEYAMGDVVRVLWILFGAAWVVLLIACGNVANLFLVRAEGRQHELAMRAALGASSGRLARALLSESVLLGLAAGALGLLLANGAIRLLRALAPADLHRVNEISLDPTVLVFTLGVSLLSGALFGLVAVFKFARPNVEALKEAGRSVGAGRERHGARHSLVVAQVALAFTLLIVSGLMIRTFVAMRQVDPGYRGAEHVQTFRISLPATLVSEPAVVARTFENIAAALAGVPGVSSVGLSSSITMDGEDNGNYIEMQGDPDPSRWPLRRFKSVGPGYFETMGIRLAAGRSMTWAEIHEKHPVVMISAAVARQFWPNPADAVGKFLRSDSDNPWRQIVGVVADERDDGLTRPATTIVYWPILSESYGWRNMHFTVRSPRVGTPAFIGELQKAVWSVNPSLPLSAIETVAEIRDRSMAQTSFALVMLGIAAAVALLLGLVGIYSVIAYVAAQRTREIGIRIALGSPVAAVRALFLRRGLSLAGIGIGVGILAALVSTRAMSALLFGVVPVDPATYLIVAATLAAAALVAAFVPAWRASRVDPIVALRSEP